MTVLLQFSGECYSERILKICQYLTKLCVDYVGLLFWPTLYVRIFQRIEYAYDTFRKLTLNSIHPADLSETYVYPFTPVQLHRSMTR